MTLGRCGTRSEREERQAVASQIVWGGLLILVGAAFLLDGRGFIDIGNIGSSRFGARAAVDGDLETRWASKFSPDEWIAIDLGGEAMIHRVALRWEKAYATAYELQVSDDDLNWTTVIAVDDGDGGVDEHEVDARSRYVRMVGLTRATSWGYSLWEFDVYGKWDSEPPNAPDALLSRDATASVSSREGVNYWFLYWPLLVIAATLPAALVPKDNSDQAMGVVGVGVGVAFLLRNLGLMTWGFREMVPIVIVAVGLVIVLQALGQKNPPDAAPKEPQSHE